MNIFFVSKIFVSLFIPILIVNAYQTTAEGKDFAKGNEHGVVYLAQWRAAEASHKQCAPESAHCYRYYELSFSHCLIVLPLIRIPLLAEDVVVEGFVLGLRLERSHVGSSLRWVSHTRTSSCCHSSELSAVIELFLGVGLVLQVALTRSRASAWAFAPVAGHCGEFLFFSKDFA